MSRELWASDTPISQPQPPESPVLADFEGLGFTIRGMAHNITEAEAEELFVPYLAPEGFRDWMDVDE